MLSKVDFACEVAIVVQRKAVVCRPGTLDRPMVGEGVNMPCVRRDLPLADGSVLPDWAVLFVSFVAILQWISFVTIDMGGGRGPGLGSLERRVCNVSVCSQYDTVIGPRPGNQILCKLLV